MITCTWCKHWSPRPNETTGRKTSYCIVKGYIEGYELDAIDCVFYEERVL